MILTSCRGRYELVVDRPELSRDGRARTEDALKVRKELLYQIGGRLVGPANPIILRSHHADHRLTSHRYRLLLLEFALSFSSRMT